MQNWFVKTVFTTPFALLTLFFKKKLLASADDSPAVKNSYTQSDMYSQMEALSSENNELLVELGSLRSNNLDLQKNSSDLADEYELFKLQMKQKMEEEEHKNKKLEEKLDSLKAVAGRLQQQVLELNEELDKKLDPEERKKREEEKPFNVMKPVEEIIIEDDTVTNLLFDEWQRVENDNRRRKQAHSEQQLILSKLKKILDTTKTIREEDEIIIGYLNVRTQKMMIWF